ncbi:MAG: fumarylacetoacetate hydrolase family protein [Lachnospiraceae bacterium]|nr:fumarylacetoacetate hydrolase family protein [Lachnospiraceae bacterium]
MNKAEINMFGEAFYRACLSHQQIDVPSLTHPDISYEEAYAIQNVFVDFLKKDGYTVSGKKVGLTSKAMREAANIYEPDYGYIFSEMAYENDSVLSFDNFIVPRIECELAFKLKKDLDMPNVTVKDVMEATEYVVACMEVCDFRLYRDKVQRLVQDSISDNAAFAAYVLGDMPVPVKDRDLSLVPYIFSVNNHVVEASCGAAVYDNPALSVAWLANTFNKLSDPLRKGEIILSGSAVASVAVQRGDHFRCGFGDFGEVSCTFV